MISEGSMRSVLFSSAVGMTYRLKVLCAHVPALGAESNRAYQHDVAALAKTLTA